MIKESLISAAKVLRHRGHDDLARMLEGSTVELVDDFNEWGNEFTVAVIHADLVDYDKLRGLPKNIQNMVQTAIQDIWSARTVTNIEYKLNLESLGIDSTLIQELDKLQDILVAVSTGGPRIKEKNPEYREGYARLTEQLKALGIHNPIPHADLWHWYGKWARDLPTYKLRREYIRDLCEPLRRRLLEGPSSSRDTEPTGWTLVDRQLLEVRARLESASTEEQFQGVGHLCREALISLAATVFDPHNYPPLDVEQMSPTDVKRVLESYLAIKMEGESNSRARKYVRASFDLANHLHPHFPYQPCRACRNQQRRYPM